MELNANYYMKIQNLKIVGFEKQPKGGERQPATEAEVAELKELYADRIANKRVFVGEFEKRTESFGDMETGDDIEYKVWTKMYATKVDGGKLTVHEFNTGTNEFRVWAKADGYVPDPKPNKETEQSSNSEVADEEF